MNEIALLLRELAPATVGALTRRFGDFDAAEDAVQEAMLAAATQWPREGLPDDPRAWLTRVAQRRLVDDVRSEIARRAREDAVAVREVRAPIDAARDRDDTLTLFLLCCHPVLSPAAAIALTLRAVGGLTTEEIARAFLVPESTMGQRISRAKKRLAALDRPFADADAAPERLAAVLHVLYVMFAEGHTATTGDSLYRTDLSAEAIRLTRVAHRLLPDDPEVTGLLALMLLTDARRAARTGPAGELVPLADQDRTRWDRARLTEGLRLATEAIAHGLDGPYRLQAAIAAVHAEADRAENTDWSRILLLYNIFDRIAANPMVTLNRAVAVAMVHGPRAGLELLATLDDRLPDHHRLAAVRGHLHEMAGETDAAIACYTAAAHRTASTPERDYLLLRAARLRTE
ncbi:RNA polymerase sigma factor [Nocardia sp. NPDC003482]